MPRNMVTIHHKCQILAPSSPCPPWEHPLPSLSLPQNASLTPPPHSPHTPSNLANTDLPFLIACSTGRHVHALTYLPLEWRKSALQYFVAYLSQCKGVAPAKKRGLECALRHFTHKRKSYSILVEKRNTQ